MDGIEIFLLGIIILLVLILIVQNYIHRKNVNNIALNIFREWASKTLENERENIRKEIDENLRKEYELKLKEWQDSYTEKIREEAIKKSQNVLKGKVTEQIFPYFSNFPYDPRDVRFLGSPVDLIVFSGLREKGFVEKIVFIEVKTGKSRLSESERSVRDAVEKKLVDYEIINIEDFTGTSE